MLAFLEGDEQDSLLPADPRQRRAVLHCARAMRLHPRLPGWLLVLKKIRHGVTRWLTCPPVECRWDVIRVTHEVIGHAGVENTLLLAHEHFHWAGIKADITSYIKCCDACQRRHLVLSDLPELEEPELYAPLMHVHIDLAGPFQTPVLHVDGTVDTTASTYKTWVVLMVDYFTKVAEFVPVPTKEPTRIASAFWDHWICRYGVPEYVTSDNGTEFAAEFAHMLCRLGVYHIHTAVCHPSANGAVERLVRSFKDMLAKHVNDQPLAWIKAIPSVRMAYMRRLHTATGVSPFQMLMGFMPKLPLPVSMTLPSAAACAAEDVSVESYVQDLQEQLSCFDQHALAQIKAQYARNAQRWAERRKAQRIKQTTVALGVGDWVLELRDAAGPLAAQAVGPYRIVAFKGSTAVLETGSTAYRAMERFERHVTRLVRYLQPHQLRAAMAVL